VRRSTILLKDHIVIISLGYWKQFQHVEVIVWRHSAFRKETRANHVTSGKSTPHFNFRAITLMFNKVVGAFVSPYSYVVSMDMSQNMKSGPITEYYTM
jgi:hypothetical protein